MNIRLCATAITLAWPCISNAAEMVALAETVVTATRQEARANEVMAVITSYSIHYTKLYEIPGWLKPVTRATFLSRVNRAALRWMPSARLFNQC